MEKIEKYCPCCKELMYLCLDEWGHTMWHWHCNDCNINIGTAHTYDIDKIIQTYPYRKNMYLEFYNNKIQALIIDGKEIICLWE